VTPFDVAGDPVGATPLDATDIAGLIPTWVATRGDLDQVEQENIAKALVWSVAHGPETLAALLSDDMLRSLHRRMFGDVWRWAGVYRMHDTNLGVHWPYIGTRVCDLVADVTAQTLDPECLTWSADELSVRFHHRLVTIHPFPNGNGRHARFAADLLVGILGEPPFTWGGADLARVGSARTRYLAALRHADERLDYRPLIEFARS